VSYCYSWNQEEDTTTIAKIGLSICGIYCTLFTGVVMVVFLILWGPHSWGFLWGITWLLAIVCIISGVYIARRGWEKAEKASRW
jgi:hypothetical protein